VKIKIDGMQQIQQNLITMSKPYTDIEVTDKYIIREFNENIDPIRTYYGIVMMKIEQLKF
jgi:hypothetical protein